MYIWHIGMLTDDIDETMGAFCALPLEAWTVMEVEFPQEEMLVGGGGRLKIAFARLADSVYEVIQPLDAHSYHASELQRKGPGLHHIAYVCPDDMSAVTDAMLNNGGKVVWETRHGDENARYIETADGKMIYELINVCPFMPE